MMDGFRQALTRAVDRVDGWANLFTGVGTGRRTAFTHEATERLGDALLERLYHEDPYAARIAECVPKHALRRGFDVKVDDPAVKTALTDACRRLGVAVRMREAWTWARVFGGGALVVGADDGRESELPIDTASLRRVVYLVSVTSRELWPETWETNPRSSRFGEPLVYRLQRSGGGGGTETTRVHHSRVIRFEGLPTTRDRRIALKGWGESYLQRAIDLLTQWNGAHEAVNVLLHDASQGVFAMKDLMTLVGSDPDGLLKKRMEVMDMFRSGARSIILDAEGESFTRTEVGALSGLPDVLDRFTQRLAGAMEIPVSVLLGRDQAGLATGESDLTTWDNAVDAERQTMLVPAIEQVVRLLLLSREGPTAGREPAGWKIELHPLRQPTPKEQAELRKAVADTDVAYIQAGVLTPEEVATSRFPAEGWNAETTIDLDVRRASLEADRQATDDPEGGGGVTADAGGADVEGVAGVLARVAVAGTSST